MPGINLKSACLPVFVFIFVSAAVCADNSLPKSEEISSTGQVSSVAGFYSTGVDSSVSIKAGHSRIDLLADARMGAIKTNGDARVKIEKGTAWVRCGDEKAVITAGSTVIEAENAVFSASPARINVYSGFVTAVNGKKNARVGMGFCLKTATGKISVIGEDASGKTARQINMDKLNLLCTVVLEPKDYNGARAAFAGAFTAFYHAGKAYFSFDSPREDFDLSFDLKIGRKDQKYLFNGIITNPITGETVGVFSDEEPSDANGMSTGLSKAGLQAGRTIQYYGSKILTEGTRVFVEADGGNTENANEIKQILEKTPGISALKYTDYQGKKAVFDMISTGNGYDIADILKAIKVQNKHINIWKYSKFVVKLTIA